jgi:two-component system sensor histidine kinase DctS
MGEISSMLAHELNQPLAAISSYTAGALNVLARAGDGGASSAPLDAGMLKRALEQANTQARRAGQIIRSVHEFVKKREPRRESVTVQHVVDGIRALVDLQARQSYVTLHIDVPSDLPQVAADRVLLEQVLLNLTRNAIESMQDIDRERRVLRIAAGHDEEQGQVSVSVIDNGHGIPPEVAERLFSPFFSTKAEGMGMGLSICRTAIEFHGGTLTHADNPGGGTVFTFTLQQAQATIST